MAINGIYSSTQIILMMLKMRKFSLAGFITSPKQPGSYPNNLNKTDIVTVEEGMILSLEFIFFDVHEYASSPDPCSRDHLTVVDGDGTILLPKTCGTSLPTSFRSRSNLVNIIFFTNCVYRNSANDE